MMGYFPLCIDLDGTDVILAGSGEATREKLKILLSFGARVRLFSMESELVEDHPRICHRRGPLTQTDLEPRPALVVVTDLRQSEKERISALCQRNGIPVNVVDEPALCSFYFPSLITRGNLTVAVSTGGESPSAAAWLRRHLEQYIPDRTEEILDWAHGLRQILRTEYPEADRRRVLRQAVARAFEENRLLDEHEIMAILQDRKEKE